MRVVRIEAENFKRLKAVDITPDENTVVIGGRNAQGKSSVLDAIMAALAGKKGTKELSRPIRDGEKKASVVVELDDLRIERKWTASGSTVTVGPKDGSSKFNSPQAILDKLIGALAFDPLEFAEADSKKQVATLIDIIGREQFDELEAERKRIFEERTEHNRDVRNVKALIEQRGKVHKVEPVDVADVAETLEQVRQKVRLRERWQILEDEINEKRGEQATLAQAAMGLPDGDQEALVEQIRSAAEINRQAQDYADDQRDHGVLANYVEMAEECTAQIEEIDIARANLIHNAELPIAGLSFVADTVLFNGIPFEQSSAAERLKVSVAMAMAMNPELRVICIRDASLLDNESRAELVKMATEHDYQIWYEVVGDPGQVGVVIEDGQVQ